jgi:hypothetical protein
MLKRKHHMLIDILSLVVISLLPCCDNGENNPEPEIPVSIPQRPPQTGIRLAWDFSTLKKIAPDGRNIGSGYARMIQLSDNSLIAVYATSSGNTECVKSTDNGNTWSAPIVVAEKASEINMDTPDILQLQNGELLACYNPRPAAAIAGNPDPTKKFGIRTKKSYDGGLTWKDERLLYEAGSSFNDGCWEPAAIQLPNGEIQLFFSNEGIYLNSNEQNISLLRSTDNGLTWSTTPQIVSFRQFARDGMPVPVLLKDRNEIAFAIEDNGVTTFKPYIIRSTLANNWNTIIDGASPNRTYALAEKIDDNAYAGAPFLRQLATGETILSYQSTEGRDGTSAHAAMIVAIGDNAAKGFGRKSIPFTLPNAKYGNWNSVSPLADGSVVALTSTNAFSAGRSEVWMIKGHVIPEMQAEKKTITVDGNISEEAWSKDFPIFIGHQSATQARVSVVYDAQYLYIATQVRDQSLTSDSSTPLDDDAVSIYIDPKGKSAEAPDQGIFHIALSANNRVLAREGKNRSWVDISSTGIRHASIPVSGGYVQELGIPWEHLGGMPGPGVRIGLNAVLHEDVSGGLAEYKESIENNDPDKPFTWCTLTLN